MNVKIGAIIKKLRKENNVTQDALASAVGVTPQAISRWESENGYQIAQKKEAEALNSLEAMCSHSIESDKSYENDHGKHFTSIFTDKLTYEYPSNDSYYTENGEHANCYCLLLRMKHKRYDPIRNHPRFQAVVDKLNEYAK